MIEGMLHGTVPVDEAVQFLRAQNARGITPDEVVDAVLIIRDAYTTHIYPDRPIVNIVGTGRSPDPEVFGGVGFGGVSTATSLVLASMGITILKHGGRGHANGGSVAFIESVVGRSIAHDHKHLSVLLDTTNACFLDVATMLPENNLAEIRSQIHQGTVFNFAFPLASPFYGGEDEIRFIGVRGMESCSNYGAVMMSAAQWLLQNGYLKAAVVFTGSSFDSSSYPLNPLCYDTDEVSPFTLTAARVITPRHMKMLRVCSPMSFGMTPLCVEGDGWLNDGWPSDLRALSGERFLTRVLGKSTIRDQHEIAGKLTADACFRRTIALNVAFVQEIYAEIRGYPPKHSWNYAKECYQKARLAMAHPENILRTIAAYRDALPIA